MNKQELISYLVAVIFEGEDRRIADLCSALVDSHIEVTAKMCVGVKYRGKAILHKRGSQVINKTPLPTLHISLSTQGNTVIAMLNKYNTDRQFIKQSIIKIVNRGMTMQELCNALPEVLLLQLSAIRGTKTTNDLFSTVPPEELASAKKAMEQIEYFAALNLVM